MPDQLAPESAEEQDVLVDEFEELAVRGKDEARRPPGRLPDAAAVAAMATPTLCELLQDPALSAQVNAAVRAAAFTELARREGLAFARKALGKAGQRDEAAAGRAGLSEAGGRIQASLAPREERKDTAATPGGKREARPGKEGASETARAGKQRGTKWRVVEEALAPEGMDGANGHVSYWVSDEAEVLRRDRGYGLELHGFDLHTRVHVREPGDASMKPLESFSPYFGGPFDPSFAEFSGILLHEQQHVAELRAAWDALYPSFAARIEGIDAGSPEEAEAAYREAFEEFDDLLFETYFASGEVQARSKEWEHYHLEYEKRCGRPAGARGGAAQAASAGAAHGEKETAAAHGQAGMAGGAKAEKPSLLGDLARWILPFDFGPLAGEKEEDARNAAQPEADKEPEKPKDPLLDPEVQPGTRTEHSYGVIEPGFGKLEKKPELYIQGEGDKQALHRTDVAQGRLGDCYFVAALAALADRHPEAIRRMIKDNGDGTYTVTFSEGTVVVDAAVPMDNGRIQYAGKGDETEDSTEIWSALVEKAWAKLKGGYEQIRGSKVDMQSGDAMEAITGKRSKTIRTSSIGDDELLTALAEAEEKQLPMTMGSRTEKSFDEKELEAMHEEGVHCNHAYSVIEVDREGRKVRLYNPHGPQTKQPLLEIEEVKKYYSVVHINPK